MHLHEDHRPGLDALLEDAHTPIAVLVGTVIAAPVLVATLAGRQSIGSAALLYLAAIVGSWIVIGLLAGAMGAAAAPVADDETDVEPDRDPDPTPTTR